jgi:hypothetical protein
MVMNYEGGRMKDELKAEGGTGRLKPLLKERFHVASRGTSRLPAANACFERGGRGRILDTIRN